MNLSGTSVGDVKRILAIMTDGQVEEQYQLYKSLQSMGTKDQLILSLIEREIDNRTDGV
jgi:hypothetical protein